MPINSHYHAAVANDEEHARLLLAAQEEQERAGRAKPAAVAGPSLTTWSPEVAALYAVANEVRLSRYAFEIVNSGKQKPSPPEMYPVPTTALGRLQRKTAWQKREAQHQSLVARLLPGKAQ